MSESRKRSLHWKFLGRCPYREAFDLQLRLRRALREGEGPEHFLLLEHPHVYTLGRNARPEDVLASAEWLRARGVEVHESDRGGQVTYHGPGQLVGYPVLDLSPDRRDVRRFVRDLQEVLLGTLEAWGIQAHRREGKDFIGIWVGDAKIASIGVHLSRWITTHGFALNVAPDLSYFQGIVPCGLPQAEVTSVQALTGRSPSLAEVAATCVPIFARVFDRELVPGLSDPRGAGPAEIAATSTRS